MELDDLKNAWQQKPQNKISNTDIMELIQHKSYGPISALKRGFKKEMILMALVPALLLAANADNLQHAESSIILWSYVAFCIAVVVAAYYNLKIVKKMQVMDGNVKQNLEQQVNVLERHLKFKVLGSRIAIIFFMILLEVVPYIQYYRMLDKWHSVHIAIRFGAYIGMLLLHYFLSKKLVDRKFGSHIRYLKTLIEEMR